MLKILYIISTLEKTGPVNVLFDIIQNIDRNKFEPVILTLSKEKKNSIKSKFENLNVEIHSMNLQGVNGYLNSFKIKSVVQKIKPNIIHTHCFRSTLFTALYLNAYKTMTTIHCDYDIDYAMSYGKFCGFIMQKLMDYSLTRVKNKICCSELLYNILSKKKHFAFTYINNGINTEIFKPIENKINLRQKLNLPSDKRIFIWVGCLTDRKNPLLFAKTINKLNDNKNYYIFCGAGNLSEKLKEIVANNQNVLLAGNVNNIQEYLQSSDYYVSTSYSEGLPLSVLEGMACGLPVILSDIPQHKCLLKDNVGLLYDTGNISLLGEKIKMILNKNYKELSRNSHQVALQHFGAKRMTQNYIDMYKEIGC